MWCVCVWCGVCLCVCLVCVVRVVGVCGVCVCVCGVCDCVCYVSLWFVCVCCVCTCFVGVCVCVGYGVCAFVFNIRCFSKYISPLWAIFTNLERNFFCDLTLILDAEYRVMCLFDYIFIAFSFINSFHLKQIYFRKYRLN